MVEITNESRDPNSENLKSDALFDETSLSVEAQRLERSTLRRLDSILIPLTLMLYLLAWLDRANVGNARVATITVTYVPYILAELPSNLLLKAVGPRILLPVLCTGWGTVTVLQSQIHNYEGFLACRFFLGLLEGGLFPGIVLYLAGFYRRHELQMRIAFFFSAASLSGAFSGLLAAAIQQMDGMRGLRGWQWIFLLEGLFTVCFGIVSFFLLPNGPDSVMTFTPQHIEHCVARLRLDQNFLENEKVTWKEVISVLADLHVWVACFALFCSGCCLFGLAYFSPSIVQALGYGSTKTQLMTVPPYACAFVVTMICAFFADRYRQRGLCAFITFGIALIGAALALNAKGTGQRRDLEYLDLSEVIGTPLSNGDHGQYQCDFHWDGSGGRTSPAVEVAEQ
ncbi:major facilitator superfamily domain-containing protein [Penicillium paradoxum]|uniref:major facilitator superfamily domain-containing protein n=1 Tax=Penicillium paradoxum TaxID=176176 RepID=UPI002546867B|nr:major facilitator superfamily domain-containing protein [Penicillium paradoxum]KAJ5783289.1 major facilitator superfamily domain-containing protein [Penicillium paradoxum]